MRYNFLKERLERNYNIYIYLYFSPPFFNNNFVFHKSKTFLKGRSIDRWYNSDH